MNSIEITNPYPGLRPFEFAENRLFFGREGKVEEVLRKLWVNRFVAVVGTSGSGKSSLVRAGVLPALYGGLMQDAGSHWQIALFRPGNDPIRHLAEALTYPAAFAEENLWDDLLLSPAKTESPAEPEDSVGGPSVPLSQPDLNIALTETLLRRSGRGLLDYTESLRFNAGDNLLVVVDQFEELFRFRETFRQPQPENEAAAFVKLLLEATQNKAGRVYVVLTMRSDFLGECTQFRSLPEAINDGQYLIPRMGREQLQQAIEGPAAVMGAKLSPALVSRLLNDIGDDQDQLPVLQHALMRTWEKWLAAGQPDAPLDLPHYTDAGEMARALDDHAEQLYQTLLEERHRNVAERVFKCLTTSSDTRKVRRPTELGRLVAITGAERDDVIAVIEHFRQPGSTFLMPPRPEILTDDLTLDITHESLIRNWTRLSNWVEEETNSANHYRRLAEDAISHDAGTSGFWLDPDLKHALEWRNEQGISLDWAVQYHSKLGLRPFCNGKTVTQWMPEVHQQLYTLTMDYLEQSDRHQQKLRADEEAQRQAQLTNERLLRETAEQLAESRRLETLRAQHKSEEEWQRAEQERQLKEQAEQLALVKGREAKQAQALAAEEQRRTAQERQLKEQAEQLAAAEQKRLAHEILLKEQAEQLALEEQQRAEQEKRLKEQAEDLAAVSVREAKSARALAEEQRELAAARAKVVRYSRLLAAMLFSLLLFMTGLAGFAWKQRNNAKDSEAQAVDARKVAEQKRSEAEEARQNALDASVQADQAKQMAVVEQERALVALQNAKAARDSEIKQRLAANQAKNEAINQQNIAERLSVQLEETLEAEKKARQIAQSESYARATALSELELALSAAQRSEEAAKEKQSELEKALEALQKQRKIADEQRDKAEAQSKLVRDIDDKALDSKAVLRGHIAPITSAAFSLNGEFVVSASKDGTARLWDWQEKKELHVFQHSTPVTSANFSQDKEGKYLLTTSDDGTAWVWDTVSRELLTNLRGHNGTVKYAAFSPANDLIVTVGADHKILLWDRATGQLKREFVGGHTAAVNSADFSPSSSKFPGKYLATASDDGTVIVWETATGIKLRELKGQKSAAKSAFFSADAKRLVLAFQDGMARVWEWKGKVNPLEAEIRERAGLFIGPTQRKRPIPMRWFISVTFEWLQKTAPKPLRQVQYQPRSDDRKFIITAGEEQTVRLWYLEKKPLRLGAVKKVAELNGHTQGVNSAVFSRNGSLIVTASDDQTVRVWNLCGSKERQEEIRKSDKLTLFCTP